MAAAKAIAGCGSRAMSTQFVRRRGKGRSISLECPKCGYTQYDIRPSSRRGSEASVTCAACGHTGPVVDIRKAQEEHD